jgi:hypothetical protein
MNRFVFRRLWAALMVLTFLAGLPMQGFAMTSQMSMAASDELPMPGGPACCGDEPAKVSCPVSVCLTLSVVAFEPTAFTPIASEETWVWRQDAVVGPAFIPDPHPPRTSIPA